MGLYGATRLPAWSPEEVRHQRSVVGPLLSSVVIIFQVMGLSNLGGQVKRYWSTEVREMEWARPILARITLRQEFGHEPTASEVSSQVGRFKRKSVLLPSLNTITAAFENGDEVCPFHCCIYIPITDSVYTTESVPVETRMQRIRRESPVGDRCRIPPPQGWNGQTDGGQCVSEHLIKCPSALEYSEILVGRCYFYMC